MDVLKRFRLLGKTGLTKEEQHRAGEAIYTIGQQLGFKQNSKGQFQTTPEQEERFCAAIIEAARSPDSPLHPLFEWDEAEAAAKWRAKQFDAWSPTKGKSN